MAVLRFRMLSDLCCCCIRTGVPIFLLLSLWSCAGAPPYLETEARPTPDAVSIVVHTSPAFTLPDSVTEAPSATKLALRNALHGQGYFPGFPCVGEFCGVMVLAELVTRSAIATVGAVQGIQEAAAQAEHVRRQTSLVKAFDSAVMPLDIDGSLFRHIEEALSIARPEIAVLAGSDRAPGYNQSLTIQMSQLRFHEYRPWHSKDPTRYALVLTVTAEMKNPYLPSQPHRDYYNYQSEYLPFHDWAEQDAALFRTELQQAYQQLSIDIVDELFRIYRDDRTPGLPRTAYVRGYFFQPLYPEPVPLSLFADKKYISDGFGRLLTSEVNSRTPVIRWEAVPWRRASGESPTASPPVDPQTLRYDLRIYDAGGNELVRADALSSAHYQLPSPLAPCTLYRWTVRARFSLEGREWVTDWSGGFNGFEPWNTIYPPSFLFGNRESPSTNISDRKLYYFRFRTLDADGQQCL